MKKIIYDFHDREKIELMYHVDTTVGKNSCMACCEHCFFKNNKITQNNVQEIDKAKNIINNLEMQGYIVTPIVSDSFSQNGKYLKNGFYKKFYEKGNSNMAWTSGMPLLVNDGFEILKLAVENKIDVIVMTSHGIVDSESPFSGIIKPSKVRKAVEKIKEFNKIYGYKLKVTLTFTIGNWNYEYNNLKRYFDYCQELGVNVLRFNNFLSTKEKYLEYVLTKEQIKKLYKDFKEIYEKNNYSFDLSISEDFGKSGIDIMNFPSEVGNCPAGETFFGIVYPNIYACAEQLDVVVGQINEKGNIKWNHPLLDKIKKIKQQENFPGCFVNFNQLCKL